MRDAPVPPPFPPIQPVGPPPEKKSKAWIGCVIAAVVVFTGVILVVILASLAMPAYNRITERARMTKSMNDCKQVVLGCRMYAADNGGAYPPDLVALYPDYLDAVELFSATDKHGEVLPLVYHAGLSDAGDPETVLIEHPLKYDGKRIVGRVGGRVDLVPIEP